MSEQLTAQPGRARGKRRGVATVALAVSVALGLVAPPPVEAAPKAPAPVTTAPAAAGPAELKAQAVALVEAMAYPDPDVTPPGKDTRKAEVLLALEASIDAMDGAEPLPGSEEMFDLDVRAAKRLAQLMADPNVDAAVKDAAGQALDLVFSADRLLTTNAVEAASLFGSDPPKEVARNLSRAEAELAKGDDKAAKGMAVDAIRDYAKAWGYVIQAGDAAFAVLDVDGDRLLDQFEKRAGSAPKVADTDGDGLSDGDEIHRTGTDPAHADTDGNGVTDGAEDTDGDGLSHLDEVTFGSDPLLADSDSDGLDDAAERRASTHPLRRDTDADGLGDASELEVGTDPLDPDSDDDGTLDGLEVYTTTAASEDGDVTVDLTGVGDVADSASFLDLGDDTRFQDLPGQMSDAVDIEVGDDFTAARLSFRFDPAQVPNQDYAGLRVMYYDPDARTFLELDSHGVDPAAGIAWADTTHFSTYVLFYIPNWQAVWTTTQQPGRGGPSGTFQNLDVMLTLDSSGSMSWYDPQGYRRTAAKIFIDALLEGDRVGVVDFDGSARMWSPLTSNFEAAKAAVNRVDSSGGTNIGAGVALANKELLANGDPKHLYAQILLTDGEGAYDPRLTQQAKDAGIIIYTIGLGPGIDETLLRTIAVETGGMYFHVSSADDLPQVFRRIGDGGGVDATDNDRDGLPDALETAGIRICTGELIRTDPTKRDTDRDGRTDLDELGQLQQVPAGDCYPAASDPRFADTDDDGLLDADEIGIGTSPTKADTDGDRVDDLREITNDFDPTHRNPDGDQFTDAEELAEGSDPFEINRTGWDRVRAVAAGTVYGEAGSSACAWRLLSCDTVETLEYLGGWILSGLAFVGDIRDLAAALLKLDLGGAVLNAVGLVPLVGDATKIADTVRTFIRSGSGGNVRLARWTVREIDNPTVRNAVLRVLGAGDETMKLYDHLRTSLARSGNDMRKIETALKAGTRLIDDVPLSASQRQNIVSRVNQSWGSNLVKGPRSAAYGVETAVEILGQRGYQVLYVGRPGAIQLTDGTTKTLTSGPDIVAVRNGRTIVVEAKGSINTTTLSSQVLNSTVAGQPLVQNSGRWLRTNPQRYLDMLEKSTVSGHAEAARRLQAVAHNGGSYDAVFIGTGASAQRMGKLDDAAETVSRDAGTTTFITTINPDL